MADDEWVDIVDAEDRVIGQTTRLQMRRENLRHRCVWIVVQDSRGRLFLHLRTPTKDVYPSHWDVAVGGVVGAGEAYGVAAIRELNEELGVAPSFIGASVPVAFDDASTSVVGRAYLTRFDGTPVLQVSEVERGAWIEPNELHTMLARESFCPDGLVALRRLVAAEDEAGQSLEDWRSVIG